MASKIVNHPHLTGVGMSREGIEISCGVPGTEDVEFIEGSKAIEEFEVFITLLEQEHDVYSGNDFRV